MNKKLALRTAKLSSESHKLKNASNLSATFEHQPKDPDERRHGILFAVIDISGESKKADELIDLILDTFHGEYYQDIEKDPLTSFENALSKINEELGEYTNSGNTYWMGNLNAVLAVYSENVIHLTKAGKSETYLYRGRKESHISDDLAGDKVNPLRTFINITSGEVIEGDKVSILSSGILSSCSPKEIFKYADKYHPKIAIGHIADLIEGNGGSKGKNAAIIIEFLTPETLANETLEEEPEEIWLKGTSKKEILAEQTGNILQKMVKYIGLGVIFAIDFTKEKIVPTLKKASLWVQAQTVHLYRKYISKEEDEKVLMETDEAIESFDEDSIFEKAAEVEPTKPEYKSEIRIKESDDSPKKATLEKTKNTVLNNLGSFYGSATKLIKLRPPKKSLKKLQGIKKSYILIAVGLVVLIAVPLFLISKNNQKEAKLKKDETAQYELIGQKISEADAYSKKSQKLKAITVLEEAAKMASEMSNSKYFSDESKQKLAEISAQIEKISKTKRVVATTYSDTSSASSADLIGIYSIDGTMYSVAKNGDIIKINGITQKATKLSATGDIKGNVVSATAMPKIRTIELLTDTPAVYEYDLDTGEISEKTATDGWEKSPEIDSFDTNIYLLSKDRNQIYKYLRTSGGYGSKADYIADGTTPKNINSFKVDSDIYVLAEGKVLQYTAGTKQDFTLRGMLVKLNRADSMYTDGNTDKILVASKQDGYIVVLNKEGRYLGKYISDGFKDMQNVFIKENTVYVALKNKILSFDIK